ncbi:IS1595 family transposase [Qipengyuania flava]|jgi:transposase-like protein|uniref:IS1595 family transposase n=1 Tax=Qipengyuania flava TaxID=192812 RepID=UPI001ADC7D8E|nr:IS1595 family transposase [Qipengyuania flava]MBO9503764.1 IS1595 family transposase [Qipengyuania flava]
MSVLSKPYFHNEEAAFAYLESVIWADGAVCPHCGGVDRITKVKANPEKRIRVGLWRCGDCKKQFTVKVGTVFEHARIPMHKMLQAVYLVTSSKKGISAHQLHRTLEITYKSASFLLHRIREAMRDGGELPPMGGNGGIVEVDETFIGKKKGAVKRRAFHHKMKVLALVDRDTRKARTMVIDDVKAETLMPLVIANVEREARIMTDEHSGYRDVKHYFAGHGTTSHGKGEYVNFEDRSIHSNTVEGYFSIFKRGMKGVYQHCGEDHLHRYLAEFEFRYNNRAALGCNDTDRSVTALKGIVGKRLTYETAPTA